MSAAALVLVPLAAADLPAPRQHGQTAASFRRAELLRNVPALREHVSREWCPVHRRYARKLSQFDSLERASSPAALAKMCPNPGTSGYSCNILRIWRTLVPAVVSGMRALGIWPAWAGGADGSGMSLYTCAALGILHAYCMLRTPRTVHRMHTAFTPHGHVHVPGSASSSATRSTSSGTSTQLPSCSVSTRLQACPPRSRAR